MTIVSPLEPETSEGLTEISSGSGGSACAGATPSNWAPSTTTAERTNLLLLILASSSSAGSAGSATLPCHLHPCPGRHAPTAQANEPDGEHGQSSRPARRQSR